jgi:hypothetical protein
VRCLFRMSDNASHPKLTQEAVALPPPSGCRPGGQNGNLGLTGVSFWGISSQPAGMWRAVARQRSSEGLLASSAPAARRCRQRNPARQFNKIREDS